MTKERKPLCAMGLEELCAAALVHADRHDDPELAFLLGFIHGVAHNLLSAAQGQHIALDYLLAERCTRDKKFRPSEHPMWPMMVRGNAAIQAAKGEEPSA